MKRVRFLPVLMSLVLLCALFVSSSLAQQAAPVATGGAKDLVIRDIKGSKEATPEYQLLKGQVMQRARDWYKVQVTYDTDPDYLDEVMFTYYILMKNPKGQVMFRGQVTYVNIQKGKRHKSDVYLHPSTLARYGEVQGVGVVVSAQGRVMAMERIPSSSPPRWWEQLTPVEGLVLNRMQTPFAMINFDDYEAIKPK